MALFEKMKDSISIAGQGVSQKAKSATESVKLNNQIKSNERMLVSRILNNCYIKQMPLPLR